MSKDLSVMYDENLTFIDFTQDSRSFIRDAFSLAYVSAPTNHLYIGLYKPFYNFFIELTTVAENPVLDFEYFDGSIWKALSVIDSTKNLKRSGFIQWERELSDWVSTAINEKDRYFVRVSANIDFTAVIDGLNIVFSDDNDLIKLERRIMKQLAKGDKSFIAYHESALEEIIQRYRNSGNNKRKEGTSLLEKITKWDILDIENLRQASKFLTMAKIMFDVSEQNEDKYYQKFHDYMGQFGEAFRLNIQRLDKNDDGKIDIIENNTKRSVQMVRL